ncbi:hypothetical protein [Pseudomonas syringae]|uniref:hypothetical protein n=1 Tax=Pseudomonas syringae TaxID=317 RepID=UPI000A5F2E00|nr:hypothetical protein [Pseudomonas syringae]
MKVITRRCMAAIGILAVLAVYAAGAYQNELSRQATGSANCTFGHCAPLDASFSALR